jgi:hypothetical protein
VTNGSQARHAVRFKQASLRPRPAREAQDHSPALPRTSRFRARDHEGDYTKGCLGAPMRYDASRSDSDDRNLS